MTIPISEQITYEINENVIPLFISGIINNADGYVVEAGVQMCKLIVNASASELRGFQKLETSALITVAAIDVIRELPQLLDQPKNAAIFRIAELFEKGATRLISEQGEVDLENEKVEVVKTIGSEVEQVIAEIHGREATEDHLKG